MCNENFIQMLNLRKKLGFNSAQLFIFIFGTYFFKSCTSYGHFPMLFILRTAMQYITVVNTTTPIIIRQLFSFTAIQYITVMNGSLPSHNVQLLFIKITTLGLHM